MMRYGDKRSAAGGGAGSSCGGGGKSGVGSHEEEEEEEGAGAGAAAAAAEGAEAEAVVAPAVVPFLAAPPPPPPPREEEEYEEAGLGTVGTAATACLRGVGDVVCKKKKRGVNFGQHRWRRKKRKKRFRSLLPRIRLGLSRPCFAFSSRPLSRKGIRRLV